MIQEGRCIARRAFGGAGDQRQSILGNFSILARGDTFEHADHIFGLDSAQIEALATTKNRHRNLANFGRGEDEFDVRGGFFERFQQGIERRRREHMNFVDDVDFVACRGGAVMHAFDDFADIANACARCGVHFHDVDVTPFHDCCAILAHAARFGRGAARTIGADTIDPLGDDPCGCGFAGAANARHHEGLRNAICLKRVFQRAHHRLLADQIDKGLRAILAGKDAIGGVGRVCHMRFQIRSVARVGRTLRPV